MKARLLMTMLLMVGLLSLSSFSSGKSAQAVISGQQLTTTAELGDFMYNGVLYFVFGDPVTFEIEYITNYGFGPDVLSFEGSIVYISGMGKYADICFSNEFGGGEFHGWLLYY